MIVPIAALVTRETPNPAKVEAFRKMLRAGVKLPPIRIVPAGTFADGNGDRRRWYLLDGHHRARAMKLCGCTHITAEIVSLDK